MQELIFQRKHPAPIYPEVIWAVSSCYEPGSIILKTRDFIEAKLKVWGDKKKSESFGTKCWGKLIPQRWNMLQKKRENIIFLPFEKVFKIKPGWKAHSRNPGKKVVKKLFFQLGYGVILENKIKMKKRSFINWNEHRETKNARIGTKIVLRVNKSSQVGSTETSRRMGFLRFRAHVSNGSPLSIMLQKHLHKVTH